MAKAMKVLTNQFKKVDLIVEVRDARVFLFN